MHQRPSRLLELGFVRNAAGATHLMMFVVAAVSTVLLTRGVLALAGWPQISGGTLHIAHLLPGGVLMLVALFLLLSYIGPVIRPVAATVGGVGFGLFIDEVGKFVTADHDYFFQPAAAIMYVVFVLLVLAIQFLHGGNLDSREHLANAVDHAVEGVAGGLSERRRELTYEQLDGAAGSVGEPETRALVAACGQGETELPAVSDRIRRLNARVFAALSSHRWATRAAVAVVALQAVYVPADQIVERATGAGTWTDLPFLGISGGSFLTIGLAGVGLLRLWRGRAVEAMRAFQLCVMAFLLVVRVFTLAHSEFGATTGVLIDLALLGVIGAKLDSLRREQDPLAPDAAASAHPDDDAPDSRP